MSFVPDVRLDRVKGPIDTLLVAGGTGTRRAEEDEWLVDWIAEAATRSRRVASVCTGAFLLAKAGLLDGRRATTHWASCADLELRYPAVHVESRSDLRARRQRRDLGGRDRRPRPRSRARRGGPRPQGRAQAARHLVVFLQRPGGQAQFSAQLSAQTAERAPLRELQAWIPDHLDEDLSVPALARRACMSDRNFARAFRRETGRPPGAYVEEARVESARIALETGDLPVEVVARQAGFGTVETLRRAFRRQVGVSPNEYRTRFRRQAA